MENTISISGRMQDARIENEVQSLYVALCRFIEWVVYIVGSSWIFYLGDGGGWGRWMGAVEMKDGGGNEMVCVAKNTHFFYHCFIY